MLNKMLKDKVPMKTYCFADEESFVPDHFAYVLEHVPDLQEAQSYMEKRGIKKGLDRMAFHMFNSIIPLKTYNCQKLFTKAPSESGHVTKIGLRFPRLYSYVQLLERGFQCL
jgi:hypothetical protein